MRWVVGRGVRCRRALLGGALAGVLGGSPPAGANVWPDLEILGERVAPGQRARLPMVSHESFAGAPEAIPVIVVRGLEPGPTLCVTGGVHGDELNGVEVARRILAETDAAALRGTLIGVPIVNLHGFRRSTRYLPDRRDLNRYFPGHPRGSSASRIAAALFQGVIRHCGALVDLHTGSFHRANLPQVRGNLRIPSVAQLAGGFGSAIAVHNEGRPGTLRRAATDAGIAAITYEGGEPMRFQTSEIEPGVQGLRNVLAAMGMLEPAEPAPAATRAIYYRSRWVRVDDGGILMTRVRLGDRVQEGEKLGTVTDPISNEETAIRAPGSGRIIGMALDQLVIPGFAAFHLAFDARTPDGDGVARDEEGPRPPPDGRQFESSELEERPE